MASNKINPNKPFKGQKFGQDIRSNHNDIVGFINRDSQITERLAVPKSVYPLGRDFGQMLTQKNAHAAGWHNGSNFMDLCADVVVAHEAVPGIAAVEFQPVYADANADGISQTKQAYLAKWMASRGLSNEVKSWQPGDCQAVDLGLATAVMMAHYVRRILAIMRDVAQQSDNQYYNGVAMLKAMGLDFTQAEIGEAYDSLWSVYNKSIVSVLDSNQWLEYSFPGSKRWARLCDNVYRDTSVQTHYAQYFIFVPACIPTFDEVQAPDGTVTYYIDCKRDANSKQLSTFDYFATVGTPIGQGRGKQQVMMLLNDMIAFNTHLFYNDSTKSIIATLNAMNTRGYANELSRAGLVDVERIDFVDLNSDHSAPEVYDETLLIALANATIAPEIITTAATIDAKSGDLEQELMVVDPTSVDVHDFSNPIRLGFLNLWAPKILNFPSIYPTQSDYISMSQWTLSLSNTLWADWSPDPQYSPNPYLPSTVVGSDYIKNVKILTRDVTSAYYKEVTDPRSYLLFDYTGVFLDTRSTAILSFVPDLNRFVNYLYNNHEAFEQAQQFAFIPTPYRIALGTDTLKYTCSNIGPIVQSDVYYIADGDILKDFHSQWKANFWGFPIYNNNAGVPDLSTQSATYSTFLAKSSPYGSKESQDVDSES